MVSGFVGKRQVRFNDTPGRFGGAGPYLALPPLAWLVVFSLVSNVQLGIRYVLPVLPFAFVWAGSLLRETGKRRGKRVSTTALTCLGATVLSTLLYFPDYIAYSNELVRPSSAHLVMADSNLDWGQDHQAARVFAREQGLAVDPPLPRTGRLIAGASRLAGEAFRVSGIRLTPMLAGGVDRCSRAEWRGFLYIAEEGR